MNRNAIMAHSNMNACGINPRAFFSFRLFRLMETFFLFDAIYIVKKSIIY